MTRPVLGAVLLGLSLASLAGCIGFTGDPTVAPVTSGRATPSLATPGPAASEPPVELTVFAAASLTRVLDELKRAYEAATPGTTLVVSTDSSAALRVKIEQGAPADVFLSADTDNAIGLVDAGLASENVAYFAGAWLTIAVPAGNPARISSPFDLAKPDLRIIAAADPVPITRYASQLVENLAAQPGAPGGFAAAYAANVVSREDNVSAVVTKIALGEGDAAIVYEPDATGVSGVETVAVALANVDAIYAGVALVDSHHPDQAAAFLSWLGGREAGRILVDAGFFIPPA